MIELQPSKHIVLRSVYALFGDLLVDSTSDAVCRQLKVAVLSGPQLLISGL